ncbi:hypothetical protein [Dichotomicrobium thermohalophilum]|uniref:hypothetical protein n=1 Tax=Dichotomicrobium thermohalophilum TaxID=933063 RepID=UPI0011C241D0|nr:hypothetical protein [Dichotomicrobium thermohalophilum]
MVILQNRPVADHELGCAVVFAQEAADVAVKEFLRDDVARVAYDEIERLGGILLNEDEVIAAFFISALEGNGARGADTRASLAAAYAQKKGCSCAAFPHRH